MTAEKQRGLTWSKKWHIVDEGKSNARYDIALCGAFLYSEDKERATFRGGKMPDHLVRVINGTAKSTGECKLCNRSVGIRTVTVELPSPPWKFALGEGDAEDVHARDGLVVVSGIDAISPSYARELAGVFLAAADAAEAK